MQTTKTDCGIEGGCGARRGLPIPNGYVIQPRAARSELPQVDIEAGRVKAEELLRRYCSIVHAQTQNIEETARRLDLDRRTLKGQASNPGGWLMASVALFVERSQSGALAPFVEMEKSRHHA